MSDGNDFGSVLRGMRELSQPEPVPTSTRRRTTGMRRQELAEAAGVSVDYVVRLEQGRSRRPSDAIVDALARALRADAAQAAALFQAAGYSPPNSVVNRTLDPALGRLLERVGDVAAAVYSADWWMLGWNELWAELLGDPSQFVGRERNLVWQVFASDMWRPIPKDRSLRELKIELASDLRRESVMFPQDPTLHGLVDALRANGGEFQEIWQQTTAARHVAERKNLRHPSGDILLDADIIQLQGNSQNLVIYSAVPGSSDAAALAKLRRPSASHIYERHAEP